MKKIVDYALIILSLLIAAAFYFHFDLEGILWDRRTPVMVSQAQMEEDVVTDYTGLQAGEGVISLKTAEEWENVLNEIDYVTVVPVSIVKTDVYSLAKWSDYFTRRRNGTTGRRRPEVKQTSFDLSAKYSPYYIIELEDGTHLLAQMNRHLAARIAKGEHIQLPLGRKLGFSQTAKNLLAPICESMGASTDYVLYTIDDNWEAEHETTIFFGKIAVSAVLFLVIGVILLMVAEKFRGA